MLDVYFDDILTIDELSDNHCWDSVVDLLFLILENKYGLGMGGIDRVQNCYSIHDYFSLLF